MSQIERVTSCLENETAIKDFTCQNNRNDPRLQTHRFSTLSILQKHHARLLVMKHSFAKNYQTDRNNKRMKQSLIPQKFRLNFFDNFKENYLSYQWHTIGHRTVPSRGLIEVQVD